MGVTSRITLTRNPTCCRARMALSRPDPGPLTNTAMFFMPWSIALRPASSAASWAANGVLLREPLKPRAPALAQEMALPLTSVMVTTVLLNVDWMCAIPAKMFFLTSLVRAFFAVAMTYFSLFLKQGPYLRRAKDLRGPLRVRALV